jgi:hypothetical protein
VGPSKFGFSLAELLLILEIGPSAEEEALLDTVKSVSIFKSLYGVLLQSDHSLDVCIDSR